MWTTFLLGMYLAPSELRSASASSCDGSNSDQMCDDVEDDNDVVCRFGLEEDNSYLIVSCTVSSSEY